MFDIAFSELLVIALVALLVIGPEKLPKVARTMGHLTGRLQRYVSTVKADIERELHAEELRRLQTEVRQEAGALEQSVRSETEAVSQALQPPADLTAGAKQDAASR
ncbi:MAG: twin-arginine translocase subunit TatB [Methylobacterium sp.]|nr:twin-arginine translocase subunit TatB [Methylobacterium sp.]